MNKLRLRKFCAAPSLFVAASLVPVLGFAQATDSNAEGDQPVKLEKYEVTGSYIPYSADAPAVPVRTVGIGEIEATGQTADLLEVIRKTVPQFVGNGNLGSANSNISGGTTNGGSQIQLRNVKTLVLINGRRAAFAPVGATGGFDFVDVNAIPVSAVESIEFLKDGASATYGSDAVSGVVNIILKKDYEGAEVRSNYSVASEGGYTWEERSASMTVGAKSGNTSLTLSAEWVRSDPLFLYERRFSFDQSGKSASFPGAVAPYFGDFENYFLGQGKTPPLNTDMTGEELVAAGIYTKPAAFTSLFNLNNATLATANEKFAVVAAFGQQISDNVEAFGDILYSHTDVRYQLNAQPIVGMPYFADHVDGFGGPTGYTEPDHPQNPFDDYVLVRNRFTDYPRRYIHQNDSIHGVAGLKGQINDLYSWEVGANLNKVTQMFTNENVINRVNLANSINSGLINLFKRDQDPGAIELANLFGTAYSRNESSLIGFDARLNGGFENILPAGAIMFAVGLETRRETLSARPDAGSNTIVDPDSPLFGQPSLWDGATTADDFNVHRSVDSVFAEVRVPLIGAGQAVRGAHTLDLDLAVRHDKYSDTDDPTVPKISLRWAPINDEFAVRGSYSESFSAASLFSLFGPSGVGFTDQPIGLKFVDGRVMDDNVDQAFLRVLSNPNLKPEEAQNYNVGVVYSPRGVKGLAVELNYFYIKQDQIAGSENETDILQDVETNGAASEFADRVRINGFNGEKITGPGQVSAAYDLGGGSFTRVFVSNFSENFVSAKQDGVDLDVTYTFDVPSVARFNTRLNGVWFNSFKVEDEDYVGTTNGNSVLNGGTIPRWIGNLGIEAQRGNLVGGVYITHIPSVTDTTADSAETDVTADAYIESFTSVDVYLGYMFKGGSGFGRYVDGLELRVGARNVFNEQPPLAESSWTDSGADTSTYGALGRVLYVSARYKF